MGKGSQVLKSRRWLFMVSAWLTHTCGRLDSRDQNAAADRDQEKTKTYTNPKALRTHILRLLGLKTILYKAFGPF